jgi:hypothetical protein
MRLPLLCLFAQELRNRRARISGKWHIACLPVTVASTSIEVIVASKPLHFGCFMNFTLGAGDRPLLVGGSPAAAPPYGAWTWCAVPSLLPVGGHA